MPEALSPLSTNYPINELLLRSSTQVTGHWSLVTAAKRPRRTQHATRKGGCRRSMIDIF
jgi:hypothetical protein